MQNFNFSPATLWTEFFISLIISKLIQEFYLPDVGMVIILPIILVIFHLILGDWLEQYAGKDLFKGKNSEETYDEIQVTQQTQSSNILSKIVKFIVWAVVIVIACWSAVYFYYEHQDKISKTLITADQLEFREFSSVDGLNTLSGEVKNNSDYELTSMILEITAFDCPTPEVTADCETVGQDTQYVFVDIPPKQVRNTGKIFVSFDDMPKIKGTFFWNYSVKEIRAEK